MKKLILEASNNLQIQKAMIPFLKAMKQATGMKLYFSFTYMEVIKRSDGVFQTVTIYFGTSGLALRLDFRPNEIQPARIDFYITMSSDPQWTLDVEGLNIMNLVEYLASVLKTKKPLQYVESRKLILDIDKIKLKEAKGSDLMRAWLDTVRADRNKGLPYISDTPPKELLRDFWAADRANMAVQRGQFDQVLVKYLGSFGLVNKNSKVIAPVRAPQEVGVPTRLDIEQQVAVDTALNNGGQAEENFTSEEAFAMMDEAYKKVLSGEANLALISGDSGIGKSFSLHEDQTNSLLKQYGYSMNVPIPKLTLATYSKDEGIIPIDEDVQKWSCRVGDNNLIIPETKIETTPQSDEFEGESENQFGESAKSKKKRIKEDEIDDLIRSQADVQARNQNRKAVAFFRTDVPKGKCALISKGRMTTSNLYKILWEYNGKEKVLIFDDINSILEDPDMIEILKAATDSYPVRRISSTVKTLIKEGYPLAFGYTGRIIIITNKYLNQLPSALKGRALETASLAELNLSFDQIMGQIRKVLGAKWSPDVFQKAFDYVYEVKQRAEKGIRSKTPFVLNKFEMRLFNGIANKVASGLPNWKALCDQAILAKYHPSNVNTKSQ